VPARANSIFLALMANNALTLEPPLGLFRQLVLERSGEHRDTLDLKRYGIMPVVELARVRCLATGEFRTGTRERLLAAAERREISRADADNLIDALDFIDGLRLEHQARQLRRGIEADNYLPPTEVSHLTRQNLKAAFSQIRVSQAALRNRFQAR
jgi:CBS domain-containing protein